ncbi:hypothetical protein IX55_09350 [Paracoccus sanguinis]|nr:hypothetical protein IX55_09350 [Paracoccus sanguinis]
MSKQGREDDLHQRIERQQGTIVTSDLLRRHKLAQKRWKDRHDEAETHGVETHDQQGNDGRAVHLKLQCRSSASDFIIDKYMDIELIGDKLSSVDEGA